LTTKEVVHHVDGDKQNNEPDNLQVMTRSEHVKVHRGAYAENAQLRQRIAELEERIKELEE
jgi:cell division protein FtsB